MAIKMQAVHGETLLLCILRRIELAKELFILEIETGQEVFIPKDLTMDHMPYTMRFYDPISAII